MTPAAELRRDLGRLPPQALVPVGWVLERLSATQEHDRQPAEMEIDLTVEKVATLLDKKPSTIRAYCNARLFPGAYRLNGKQWRVPRSAITAFQRQQRQTHTERST
jgi:hypothetical protein